MAETNEKSYIPWANAGGPNECEHGYAAGIPCPKCPVDQSSPSPTCTCCNDLAQIAAEFADAERYGRTAEGDAHRQRGMEIIAKHASHISYESVASASIPQPNFGASANDTGTTTDLYAWESNRPQPGPNTICTPDQCYCSPSGICLHCYVPPPKEPAVVPSSVPQDDILQLAETIVEAIYDGDFTRGYAKSIIVPRTAKQIVPLLAEVSRYRQALTLQQEAHEKIRQIAIATSGRMIATDKDHINWLCEKLDKIHDIAHELSLAAIAGKDGK
jgi:hypothetical protein